VFAGSDSRRSRRRASRRIRHVVTGLGRHPALRRVIGNDLLLRGYFGRKRVRIELDLDGFELASASRCPLPGLSDPAI